jgi:hypothetical protein
MTIISIVIKTMVKINCIKMFWLLQEMQRILLKEVLSLRAMTAADNDTRYVRILHILYP